MTKMGDNDGEFTLVLMRSEDGRSCDYANWEDARARLVEFLTADQATGTLAVHERAEDLLCAIFSGRTAA